MTRCDGGIQNPSHEQESNEFVNWKHTGRFCLAAFCVDFANGMFLVALPYLGLSFGADSMQLGGLTALRGGAYVLVCIPTALLADRVNRKVVLGLSTIGIVCVYILATRASALWQLFAIAVFWAVAVAPFWPSLFAWLGDSHPRDQLNRATGAINLSWSAGGMLGGVLSGWLFSLSRPSPFLFATIPAIMACVAMLLSRCTHGHPRPTEIAPGKPGVKRELTAAWLGAANTALLLGLMSGVFPKLGLEVGVGARSFGLLMGGMALGRTLVFTLGLRWGHQLQDWRCAMLAQLIAAGMVATVATASSTLWLALVFFSIGTALGINYYRGLYKSLEAPGARGLKTGLHEASVLLGILFGSLGGGVVAKTWGLRVPYLPAGICALMLLAIQAGLILSAHRIRQCAE